MLIEYRGRLAHVEILDKDDSDPDMPLLALFPEWHELYHPDGVWLEARDLVIVPLDAADGMS